MHVNVSGLPQWENLKNYALTIPQPTGKYPGTSNSIIGCLAYIAIMHVRTGELGYWEQGYVRMTNDKGKVGKSKLSWKLFSYFPCIILSTSDSPPSTSSAPLSPPPTSVRCSFSLSFFPDTRSHIHPSGHKSGKTEGTKEKLKSRSFKGDNYQPKHSCLPDRNFHNFWALISVARRSGTT